ncbi:MAG TPA: acyl-CoA dehydrogenase family protein [Candidatus Saccharimonadales bacterium]
MISFALSPWQQQMLSTAATDAQTLREHAAEAYEQRLFQSSDLEVMQRYLGLCVPSELGGQSADSVTLGLTFAKLAEGNPSLVLWLSMHAFAMSEISRAESPEARIRLHRLGLTDPFCAAVSEDKSVGYAPPTFIPRDVTAEYIDGQWVLNGKKKVVTGYRQSKWMLVYAHTVGTEYTVCLAVPTGLPGMTEGEEWHDSDFLQPTNNNSVMFDDVRIGPEAFVYKTDDFLGTVMLRHGTRTFGYTVAYYGILCRLFEKTVAVLKMRMVQGRPLSYQLDVAQRMGACSGDLLEVYLKLLYALTAYDQQNPDTPRLMMLAKAAVGEAAARCEPMLRTEAGLTGLMDPETQRLRADLQVAGLMAPTTSSAYGLAGHLVMGQNPADAG